MKIHNTFEICYKEKTISAENTVTNAGKHLQQNLAYAAYLVLEGPDGAIVKKTELVKICRDINEGVVSASYRVELSENEHEGFLIERIGFSPYEDGRETANAAEFDGVMKEMGHALVVTGTVYVSFKITGANFLGGENPLCDFFLGSKELEETPFYVAPYSKAGGYGEKTEIQKDDTPMGLRLIAQNVSVGTDGIIIFMGEKPVLEMPCVFSGVTNVAEKTADSFGKVKAGDFLTQVSDVRIEGETPVNARVMRAVSGSYGYAESKVRLGRKGYLLTEPGGRFFAAAGEKDVMLFSAENMELIRIMKNRGERVALTEDGAVAFFGESLIILGKDGTESLYPVSADGQATIVQSEGGDYYVAAESGGYLMRYLIAGGKAKLLGMTRASDKLCLFRFGKSIAVIDGAEINITNAEGRDSTPENMLAGFALQFALQAGIDADEGLVVIRDDEGGTFAGDLTCGTLVSVDTGTVPAGGMLLVPQDGYMSLCVFDYRQGHLKEILRVDADVTDAALCGGRIITKNADGIMKTAKIIFGDTYIYHGDIAGKRIEYKISEATMVPAVNMSVYFEFG